MFAQTKAIFFPNVGLMREPEGVLNPTIASTLLRKARPFLLFPHQSKLNSDWIMRRGACAKGCVQSNHSVHFTA